MSTPATASASARPEPVRAQRGGWYHDPRGLRGAYRWWDGTAWTDWLTADASAPPPGRAQRSVRPDPLISARVRRRLLIAMAALAVLAAVLVMLTATGVQIIRARPPVDTSPPVGDPRNLAPEITADVQQVAIRGIWGAELPSYPFVAENRQGPQGVPGMFRAAAVAVTPEGKRWASRSRIGLVDDVVPGTTSTELATALLDRLERVRRESVREAPRTKPAEPVVGAGRRAGSILAEQRIVEEWPDGLRLVMINQVQAEVWPDGTRIAWTATTVFAEDAASDPELAKISQNLSDSLDTTA